MLFPLRHFRAISASRLGCLCAVVLLIVSHASAEVTAFLSKPRDTPLQAKFEVDLQLQFSPDLVGGEVELLNLDVINSRVNGTPFTFFNLVKFQASLPFDAWAVDTEFGSDTGFESQMIINAFGNTSSMPFAIADTDPVSIGTFTFNYGPLGLQPGDQITLDVTGIDEGNVSRTTSVAITEPGMTVPRLFNPIFSPGLRTVTISAVPEPGSLALVLFASLGLIRPRHRSN